MKPIPAVAIFLCLWLVSAPVFAHVDDGVLSPAGKSFLKDVSSVGLMEVQLGQLANRKAVSQEVKEFAARMALDHLKSNRELKAIAAQKNLKLPSRVERKHLALIARLSKLSGTEFDRDYLKIAIQVGSETVARLQKALKRLKDPALLSWSSTRLPVLQRQLRLATKLAQTLQVP